MATRPGVRGLRKRTVVPGARRARGHRGELVPRATYGRRMGQRPLPSKRRGLQVGRGAGTPSGSRESMPRPGENTSEKVRGHGSHFKNRQSGFHLLDNHATGWAPRPWNLNTGVSPWVHRAWHWRACAVRPNANFPPHPRKRQHPRCDHTH